MNSEGCRLAATHVALTLVATAALYASSLAVLKLPCWLLYVLVAAAGFPIWRYRREHALFERRAILAGLIHETSRIRRWFWSGKISAVLQAVMSMFWASLLLAFANLLSSWHWLVLAIDAVALSLLIGPVANWLRLELRAEQSGRAARRWPLAWINIAILSLAFFAIDFYFKGAPDTRGLAWHDVAEKAFVSANSGALCPLAGSLVGVLAALSALAWHAAEVLIPSLPNPGFRWAAWLVFLFQAGVIGFALTRFHLGLVAILDQARFRTKEPPESARAFWATAVVSFAALAGIVFTLRDLDTSLLASKGRQAVGWANPCRTDPNAIAALKASLDGRLQEMRMQEQIRAREQTNAALDSMFAQAEGGVDVYLNWYFSVLGEYQRLGATLAGQFGGWMQKELEQKVYGEAFRARFEQMSREVVSESQDRISKSMVAFGAQLKSSVQSKPCLLSDVDQSVLGGIERDAIRASTAAFGGTTVAVSAGLLARRTATAAAAKAATKPIFQGAASLGGRVVTKRAGSTLVAAAGGAAVCGPMAPLCALAAGAIVWITIDKTSIEIDELRFRDDMRKELLESLRSQKSELAKELSEIHNAAIDRAVAGVQQSMQRVFVPVREGL